MLDKERVDISEVERHITQLIATLETGKVTPENTLENLLHIVGWLAHREMARAVREIKEREAHANS
jgi:hypothetical protein